MENETNAVGTQQKASVGQRIGAYLIDVILVALIAWIPLVGLIGVVYMLLRDSLPFLDGQSVGKKVLKIRAVTSEGATLSGNWGPGIIRNIVLLIPFFPIVELIVMATNADGLRLGDQWGKTKVVVDDTATA